MIKFDEKRLLISEKINVNAIVWVRSLPEAEMGPTRRILEDLRVLQLNEGPTVFEYSASNRDELLSIFSELVEKSTQGLRPILHVDAHGSANDGLLLSPSGEYVPWTEVINELRKLNVATQNNLTCIFALCFGLHLYYQASLKHPVPAYLFCAPPSHIDVGFLEDQTLAFYKAVNDTSNVTAAFEATLKKNMVAIHCQGLMLQTLLLYIQKNCKGKTARNRLERLVSEDFTKRGLKNPTKAQLHEARKRIKAAIKPGQHTIDSFTPHFLIGRKAAFSYKDLQEMIQRKEKIRKR